MERTDLTTAVAEVTSFGDAVQRLLSVVRTQLGMDVAWLSEFVGDEQVLRFVDAAPEATAPRAGSVLVMDGTFCRRVLEGAFPPVIPDSRLEPLAALLNSTADIQIGSYVGVPLLGVHGAAVGMLCVVSDGPTPGLTERDVASLRLTADLLRDLQRRALSEAELQAELEQLRFVLQTVIGGRGRQPALQPVVEVGTGRVVAAEGLTRFTLPSPVPSPGLGNGGLRAPSQWFDDAERLGLRPELELAAAASVLDLLDTSGVPADVALSVNLAPDTVLQGGLADLLPGRDLRRIVVELTEHAATSEYERLDWLLAPYRERGLRLAVDDAGAGYASLRHVLAIRPDFVKVDTALVRNADCDLARRVLLSALAVFADAVGCRLVAEGVETRAEVEAVRDCGITLAQGHWYGAPSATPRWHHEPVL